MKKASSTILLLVCMSIVVICCNGQPLRFGGRQQQRATAAATARTITSNPSSSYTNPYPSSYPYAAATSLPTMGASLTPQQIATMMAQAQQLPITTSSSIGGNSNMMYNGINMPTNINTMRQPSSMSQPAVTQPILQQPLQQQQQQQQQPFSQSSLSSMYGGQPNTGRYQYPQQLSSMMSQPITGQTIATPAATSSLPVPTNMATSMNVNTMSSSPSVMTSGMNSDAAAAATTTSGTPTAMTLDQLFQMYPDMRAQYAGMTPSLPTSYQGVPIASSQSSSFASAPIMSSPSQSQQRPNAMMTDFSNAAPYTSYAPYAAINAAGIPLTTLGSSSSPSSSTVPLSSSQSFPSPIIANPSEPMAYIQSAYGGNAYDMGNAYAGVDNTAATAAMADNEYTTQGVTAESVNDATNGNNNDNNGNGCPSMADNPELVSQGGNSYAVTFTPTQAGIPVMDVTNVMIDGDISGRPLSSAMQSNGIGGWQTFVDIAPGDTINWSYIFNSGTSNTNGGSGNNGAPLTCQGQSYSAQIPMTATTASQPSTDASAPLVNGPSRTLLGVQQQPQQPQYQQYQQMYQPQPIYAQQPQLQQQYQQQVYQQQMFQQQQPSAGSVSDAAIRRPCPVNAVHQAIIAPLPVKTGRPIDAGATMYGVSFIANDDISPLDYVDLHYSINSGTPWQQNIRMVRNATNPNRFDYTFGLPLKQDDELGIQFTYSSQYNDCDTPEQSFNPTSGLANNNNNNNDMNGVDSSSTAMRPMMTTTTGAPTSIAASCPTISYTSDVPLLGIDDNGMDMFGLNFIGQMGAPVDWVETHYRVNNQPQQNYRMISSTPGMFELQGISMNRGDQLSYSFTHSINGIDCDTPAKTFINQGSDTITNYGINTNRNANSNGVNGVGVSPIGTPAPVVNTACGRTRYVSSVTGTPINRKNIKPGSENLYDLSFRVMDGAPLEYVDAHYTITRSPSAIQPWQTNDRMDKISGTNYGGAANGMMDTSSSTFVTPGITLLPGDILGYSFTFQPYHGDACDTATETFTVV